MKSFLLAIALLIGFQTANAGIDSMRARIPEVAALKDKGVIGEQPDGYLGVVKAGDADAQRVVDAENKDRKEEYEKRAAAKSQNVGDLAVVLGTARIREEKAGRFIRQPDGSWVKK